MLKGCGCGLVGGAVWGWGVRGGMSGPHTEAATLRRRWCLRRRMFGVVVVVSLAGGVEGETCDAVRFRALRGVGGDVSIGDSGEFMAVVWW
jgi:hypothetical protein